ncbi:Coumaroyl-CoA:anthocyanidin 3-O-glucoside-6''-O-coumaroyltransferase 1 [Raphanus sativus]|uniref:Coumaroyl-CoA:anthocyanidin 3-O-glucoside-6''-O-coumaroyltransferase 1 n=1 Tax=Raphanus sativus TaxID=3726 RepID=A0A6J0NEZ2_RAPSA|nr:coumaroyl-CoA:anthocyanidin 3-O-glucoside-6''-O-coumaroyltransferase 1 [Raphanus sativus]KAJ4901795.1 Coumaroyl-CoA:anthocyanidin 3-O-glucoside-6''-O-coumaroyltransferase 1 [Raphanus sativus]
MAHLQSLNILETSHISPLKGTVPSTTLPLTFFDAPWLTLPLGESLFFFSYQNSTERFLRDYLPNLKQSLSVTLQHFFPYAGKLITLPRPDPPYLRYNDGQDSLLFTVAESLGTDFDLLITDSPKDISVLHDFLPKLPPPHVSPEGIQTRPIMVIQVTIFPGRGICIGNTSSHVAGDGVTFTHFMKYWMSLTRSNGRDPATLLLPSPPVHSCRNVIKDPGQVTAGHLERFWSQNASHPTSENMVRATFTMSRNLIDKLKSLVTTEQSENQSPVSTFVVTLAFTWVNLIKTLVQESSETEDKVEDKDEQVFNLMINVDCRNRIKYTEPIPSTYFGNCMAPGIVSVKKRDLLGEKGFLVASDAITWRIKDMLSSDLLKTAPSWGQGVRKWVMSRFPTSIAGAPKLGLYDMDFGLGKPCKMELVHIETGGSIAFSESRDGSNGVDIGFALEKTEMDTFVSIWQHEIKKFNK